jgi:hypothetical protein
MLDSMDGQEEVAVLVRYPGVVTSLATHIAFLPSRHSAWRTKI